MEKVSDIVVEEVVLACRRVKSGREAMNGGGSAGGIQLDIHKQHIGYSMINDVDVLRKCLWKRLIFFL